MMMKKLFTILFALCLCMPALAADKVKVTVSNSLSFARGDEYVELDVNALKSKLGTNGSLVVTDADGREVASQLTYDGKLIFQVGVPAKGKSVYYVEAGTPSAYEQKVFGRQFPERVDDIAWENNRVAFRCYGPALQKSGERAWGYDIWNKRTDKLVVEERYAGELDPEIASVCKKLRARGENALADDLYNSVSYHVDHGNGMDAYGVGASLGCGAPALMSDGQLVFPYCYKTCQILDNGPLRFTAELTYGTTADGITEHRLISLDRGSHFNRMTVQDIIGHLERVATQEGIQYESSALNVIAQKADGGMRDALSIFDQVAAFCQGNITYKQTIADLNVLDTDYYFKLVDYFLLGDIPSLMLTFNEVLSKGFDGSYFIGGLNSHLRNLLISKDGRRVGQSIIVETQRLGYNRQ